MNEDLTQPPGGSLAELLAAEARLEAMLGEARAEAERLVEAARQAAQARLDALEIELAAIAADAAASQARARAEALARLETEGAVRRERWEGLGEAELTAAAEWVVERVIERLRMSRSPA